uniref:Uncharacterized protein n=1 Tax=Anopheles atroparvus TaxID=41427 RepID=A0A182JME1_ANOAO
MNGDNTDITIYTSQRCSLALMRSVAIELVRISVEWWWLTVMLRAAAVVVATVDAVVVAVEPPRAEGSLPDGEVSLSEPGSMGVSLEPLSPVGEGEFGLSDCRALPGGVSERFCGEATGIVTGVELPAEGCIGPGWATSPPMGPSRGEWRGVGGCGPSDPGPGGGWCGIERFCGPPRAPLACGGERRMPAVVIWGDMAAMLCGEMRRFCGPFGWPRPRFGMPRLDGFRLSGGVR